jgi:hypothetical protein
MVKVARKMVKQSSAQVHCLVETRGRFIEWVVQSRDDSCCQVQSWLTSLRSSDKCTGETLAWFPNTLASCILIPFLCTVVSLVRTFEI